MDYILKPKTIKLLRAWRFCRHCRARQWFEKRSVWRCTGCGKVPLDKLVEKL